MKWLDNWVQRAYNRARDNDWDTPITSTKSSTGKLEHDYNDPAVMQFKVISANGGMIVETTRYDSKSDSNRISRYVIDDSRDFTESLSHIVTMEYMK